MTTYGYDKWIISTCLGRLIQGNTQKDEPISAALLSTFSRTFKSGRVRSLPCVFILASCNGVCLLSLNASMLECLCKCVSATKQL